MKPTDLNASRKTKKTPIGDIPVDWAVVKVGDLASVKQGCTFSRNHQGKRSGKWLWAKVGDLDKAGSEIWLRTADNYVTDDIREMVGARPFRAGTTVFPRVGAALKTNKKRILAQDSIVDDNVLAVTVEQRDLCDDLYLFYWFASISLERTFSNNGLVPSIRGQTVLSTRLPLPPVPEQRKIAEILSTWDHAIFQTEQLIQAKQQLKTGLMQRLLTGKLRFPQFRGKNAGTRRTRFGMFPRDWTYCRIGDVATESKARHDGQAELPVLSCTKHQGLVDSMQYFGKRVFSADTAGYKVVRRQQFAYATNHIEEGSIGLLEDVEAGLVSPMYTVFEANARKVLPSLLFRLLKTELYRHIFEASTNASVNRRGSLRWSQFRMIHLCLPDIAEQAGIDACAAAADAELRGLQEQLAAFQQQKRGLMQKLLTGQVRARGAKEVEA